MFRLAIQHCLEENFDPGCDRLERSDIRKLSQSKSQPNYRTIRQIASEIFITEAKQPGNSWLKGKNYYVEVQGRLKAVHQTRVDIWLGLSIWKNGVSTHLSIETAKLPASNRFINTLYDKIWTLYGDNDDLYDESAAVLTGCDASFVSYFYDNDTLNPLYQMMTKLGLEIEFELSVSELEVSEVSKVVSFLVEIGQCFEPREHRIEKYAERLQAAHLMNRRISTNWMGVLKSFCCDLKDQLKAKGLIGEEPKLADLGLPWLLCAWDFVRPTRCLDPSSTVIPKTMDTSRALTGSPTITDHFNILRLLREKKEVVPADAMFDSRSAYFIKEKEKGRARTPFMIMPNARCIYMRIDSLLNSMLIGTRYSRYLGHADIPEIVDHVNEMLGYFNSNPYSSSEVYSISVDIRAFCLSVTNKLNTNFARILLNQLGFEDHHGVFVGLCDFVANISSFTPTLSTGPATDQLKADREASFQKCPDIHVNLHTKHIDIVGGPSWMESVRRLKESESLPFTVPGLEAFSSEAAIYPMVGSPEGLFQSLWSGVLMSVISGYSRRLANVSLDSCSILSGDNITFFIRSQKTQFDVQVIKEELLSELSLFGFETKKLETVIMKDYAVPLRQHIRFRNGKFEICYNLIKNQLSAASKSYQLLTVMDAASRAFSVGISRLRSGATATIARKIVESIIVNQITELYNLQLISTTEINPLGLLLCVFSTNGASLLLISNLFELNGIYCDLSQVRQAFARSQKHFPKKRGIRTKTRSMKSKDLWRKKTEMDLTTVNFQALQLCNENLLRDSKFISRVDLCYVFKWTKGENSWTVCSDDNWCMVNQDSKNYQEVYISYQHDITSQKTTFPVPQVYIRLLVKQLVNMLSQSTPEGVENYIRSLNTQELTVLAKSLYVSSFYDIKNPSTLVSEIKGGKWSIKTDKVMCPLKLRSLLSSFTPYFQTTRVGSLTILVDAPSCFQYSGDAFIHECQNLVIDLTNVIGDEAEENFDPERLNWTKSLLTNAISSSVYVKGTSQKHFEKSRTVSPKRNNTIFSFHSTDSTLIPIEPMDDSEWDIELNLMGL